MTKPQSDYELMYILDITKGEEKIKELTAKFRTLIEANGTLKEEELIGKRRMAYKINDLPEGYYVLDKFTSEHAFPAELDRILGITDGVLRRMVTKAPSNR